MRQKKAEPQTTKKSEKLNIILDLDQTVISSLEYDELQRTPKYKKRLDYFTHHFMDDHFVVCERPGLQEFLTFVFKHFNVSIWTAATKSYALFIIEKILIGNHKDRHINYIFYSDHCSISQELTGNTKDLSILWKQYNLDGFNKNNTFIIDDYDEVYDTQPDNCIISPEFEFTEEGSEDDLFLMSIIPYLNKLSKEQKLTIIDRINI